MSRFMKLALPVMVVVTLVPGVVSAQEQRFRVSFAPSVAAIGGDAELGLSGQAAYRFSEHFWFEGDLTWLDAAAGGLREDRKSTRLNSSHLGISYAVFCLKKKKKTNA